MGIYPHEQWQRSSRSNGDGTRTDTAIRTYNDYGGEVLIQVFECVAEIRVRTDCFCCSCGDRPGSDPACRNHGWAAKRPCEIHDMPGSPWDDDEDENMPESVQVYRQKHNLV